MYTRPAVPSFTTALRGGFGLRLLHPLHDFLGRDRHFVDFDAEWFERILYRACDRRRRYHASTLATTLDAIRGERRRCLMVVNIDIGYLGHSRYQVVVH